MAKTTWKQVVYDTADAYREATGTTDKIPVGELANRVREGGGKEDLEAELTLQETLLVEQSALLEGKAVYDVQEVTLDPVPEGSVHEFYDFVASKVTLNPYELPSPQGKYVWKKLQKEFGELKNPTFYTESRPSGGVHLLNSELVDLTQVDASFFDGFKCVVHNGSLSGSVINTLTFKYENGVLKWAEADATFTWDAPNRKMTRANNTGTANYFECSYNGSKECLHWAFEYIVSDNIEEYPDKGELDGYRYELYGTSEGLSTYALNDAARTIANEVIS